MTTRLGTQVAVAPAAAAVLLVAGCASGGATTRSPGVIEINTFKPVRPVAANYGPDPSFSRSNLKSP